MLANCYHGLSINFCSERTFGFFVLGRTTGDDNRDANDSTFIIFVIFDGDGKLVLFAGVKDDDWAQKAEEQTSRCARGVLLDARRLSDISRLEPSTHVLSLSFLAKGRWSHTRRV